MKNKLSILLLLALSYAPTFAQQCTLPNTSSTCPPKNIAYPNGDCFAAFDRYLAKAITADWLTQLNADWGWNNTGGNGCSDPLPGYCPQKYCEDIKTFVEMDAKLLWTVTGIWGNEYWMAIGSPYYNAAIQTVKDINKAYDCARKARPIIQAAILEKITDDVNGITIPSFVKSAFSTDPDYNASYYAPTTIKFKRSRICHLTTSIPGVDPSTTPDLNRIEARMWFYYLGKTYLDMGYRDLHMGNINVMIDHDNGLAKTYSLFQKLRDYATALGSYVLINAHVSNNLYLGTTNQLLLDYNSGPIRPKEVTSSSITSCSGSLQAAIQPLWDEVYEISGGGISPMGCTYEKTPYLAVWDHHNGISSTPGTYSPDSWWVWGYDEKRWFNTLSDNCQADWLKYYYCYVRNLYHRGFLQMPGRLTLGSPVFADIDYYRVSQHPIVENAIIDAWEANTSLDYTAAVYNYTLTKIVGYASNGQPILYCTKFRRFDVKVLNPDCSSVYTWHVQKPDGSWLPHTYGHSKTFDVCEPGTYKIGLRQDNLVYGLPTPGVRGLDKYFTVAYDPAYCVPKACGLGSRPAGPDSYDTIDIEETVISEDILSTDQIKIYPNPATTMINIVVPSSILQENYLTYCIINPIGVKAKEGVLNTSINQVDITNLNSGIYLLAVYDKQKNALKTQKISIIK